MSEDTVSSALKLNLKVGGYNLSFVLQDGFSEGYRNTFVNPAASAPSMKSHPPLYNWMGGEFKPLNVKLNLAVGIDPIKEPKDLVDIAETFYKFSLSSSPTETFGLSIVMSVGSWWSRRGHIQELDIDWKPPYDSETGIPMVATISFQFLVDFHKGKESVDYMKTIPWRDTFNFKFTGR